MGFFQSLFESVGLFFIEKFKGFDLEKMCACTLLFEGTKEEVER
jgi:hypothetical protein